MIIQQAAHLTRYCADCISNRVLGFPCHSHSPVVPSDSMLHPSHHHPHPNSLIPALHSPALASSLAQRLLPLPLLSSPLHLPPSPGWWSWVVASGRGVCTTGVTPWPSSWCISFNCSWEALLFPAIMDFLL